MSVRIYTLAKELAIDSRELIELLRSWKINVGSAHAQVSDEDISYIHNRIREERKPGTPPCSGQSEMFHASSATHASAVTNGTPVPTRVQLRPPIQLHPPGPPQIVHVELQKSKICGRAFTDRRQNRSLKTWHDYTHVASHSFVVDLLNDVEVDATSLAEFDCGARRRSYVRSCYAAIEGILTFLTVLSGNSGYDNWEFGASVPVVSDRRMTLLCDTLAEVFEVDQHRFRPSDPSLMDLARDTRNRITHPRHSRSIDVSDEVLRTFRNIEHWVRGVLAQIDVLVRERHTKTAIPQESKAVQQHPCVPPAKKVHTSRQPKYIRTFQELANHLKVVTVDRG